jgi:peptidoglycan/LPS O-acetylase OafA/YrhL
MTNPRYRAEIDGLRCIAVLSVILFHAGMPWMSGGFVGVDIFFVISGYLITGIIQSELLVGEFSLLRFYERRARRILPALFMMLSTTLVVGWIILSPGQLKALSQSAVSVIFFLSNQYFLLKTGYFSPSASELPLLHMWSLSVEEQFYLILPLYLMLLIRFRLRWTIFAMSLALLLSLALCLRWEVRNPELNFFFAGTRAWELLAGGLLALVNPSEHVPVKVSRFMREALATLGVLILLWAISSYDERTSFPGANAVLPVFATLLVITFADDNTVVGRLLSLRPIVGMGLISYSAYLWHQPVFAFLSLWNGTKPVGLTIWVALVLIFLLSWTSWRFVEQPFRDRGRFRGDTIARYSVFGSVVLGALGLIGHLENGFPLRFSNSQIALAATAAPSPKRNQCHTEGLDYLAPSKACTYFDGPVQWAVLGDSHTVEIGYALAESLKERGEGGVLHLSSSGCMPALITTSSVPGCASWTRAAIERIVSDSAISNVVVLYRHPFHLYGSQLPNFPNVSEGIPQFTRTLAPAEAREAYWQSFFELARLLRAANKTVYLLDPVPELGRHVEWHVFSHAAGVDGTDRMAAPSLEFYRERNADVLRRISALKNDSGIRHIETALAFCDLENCRVGDGQELYYFDDNHPSISGARRIVALVLKFAESTVSNETNSER